MAGPVTYNPERPLVYTYYGEAKGRGKNRVKPIVRQYRGSNMNEVNANVARFMTCSAKGLAVVCEVHDEEYGELLLVATYFPGEKFQIVFEQDTTKRVYITRLDDADLKLLDPQKP